MISRPPREKVSAVAGGEGRAVERATSPFGEVGPSASGASRESPGGGDKRLTPSRSPPSLCSAGFDLPARGRLGAARPPSPSGLRRTRGAGVEVLHWQRHPLAARGTAPFIMTGNSTVEFCDQIDKACNSIELYDRARKFQRIVTVIISVRVCYFSNKGAEYFASDNPYWLQYRARACIDPDNHRLEGE